MEALMAIPVIFVLAGLPILITWRMGKKKGRHGIWWGLILGWIGVFLLALNFPPKREKIAAEASVR
jgi:Na+-driven multidrug efflux pump